MNLLLDTHTLLWWLDDNAALSEKAKSAIANSENLVLISSVVIWEIRIKQILGKLEIDPDFYEIIKGEAFEIFSITADHAYATGNLPLIHRDPFDRMLIAQALTDRYTIVTHDAVFKAYNVPVLDT